MSLSTAEKLILFSERPFSLQDFFLRNPVDGFIYEGQDVSLAANYVAGGRSDLIVQWAESTGVTPITVTETACGLRMDNSRSLVRGVEKLVSGDFSSGTGWTPAASWTISGGVATSNGTGVLTQTAEPLVIGRTYEAFITVTSYTSGTVYTPYDGTGLGQSRAVTSVGTFRRTFVAADEACLIFGSSFVGVIDNVSVREVPGNHTLQATSAARPVVSQRYNTLISTGSYAGAAWTKRGTGAVGGAAPDGTGELITVNTVTNDVFQLTTLSILGVRYEPRIVLWPVSVTGTLYLQNPAGVGRWTIDLSLLTTGTWNVLTRTHAAVTVVNDFVGEASGCGHHFLAPAGGPLSFYAKTPDLRLLSDTLFNIPAYQYVNTGSDFQTDGFSAYDRFDGTDDSRTSATGGGSTTGFFWCGVVTVLGGAGTSRVLFGDSGAGTGVYIAVTSGNALQLGVGAGVVNNLGTLAVGSTFVLTLWHDSVTGYAQIDNGVVSSAAVTPVAGTAQITEGKTNNSASGYFDGRMYGRVYTKNYCPSANLRERVKRELARQAGCLHLLNS